MAKRPPPTDPGGCAAWPRRSTVDIHSQLTTQAAARVGLPGRAVSSAAGVGRGRTSRNRRRRGRDKSASPGRSQRQAMEERRRPHARDRRRPGRGEPRGLRLAGEHRRGRGRRAVLRVPRGRSADHADRRSERCAPYPSTLPHRTGWSSTPATYSSWWRCPTGWPCSRPIPRRPLMGNPWAGWTQCCKLSLARCVCPARACSRRFASTCRSVAKGDVTHPQSQPPTCLIRIARVVRIDIRRQVIPCTHIPAWHRTLDAARSTTDADAAGRSQGGKAETGARGGVAEQAGAPQHDRDYHEKWTCGASEGARRAVEAG